MRGKVVGGPDFGVVSSTKEKRVVLSVVREWVERKESDRCERRETGRQGDREGEEEAKV
jgi:hypothetical protein